MSSKTNVNAKKTEKKKQPKKKNPPKKKESVPSNVPRGLVPMVVRGKTVYVSKQDIRDAPRPIKNAAGVISTVTVPIMLDWTSFTGIPFGLVSRALFRNAKDPYAIYQAIFSDINNIALGGQGTTLSRLKYLNELFCALAPKTVPFRGEGKLSYVFMGFGSIPGADVEVLGGYVYSMRVPGVGTSGIWTLQDTPGIYTAQQIAAAYVSALGTLVTDAPHTALIRDAQLSPKYKVDLSAFCQASSYFGDGLGVGAPFLSVEGENYFKSGLLGVLVQFAASAPRASRKLCISSGDACSNYSIGSLPSFPPSYYESAVPPIYKFLDMVEFVNIVILFYVNAANAMLNNAASSDTVDSLTGSFGCTYQQFIMMVRQQVLYLFGDSQSIAQFLAPETYSANSFLPLLCGSNCYPSMPKIPMLLPGVLNENLRMLMMATHPYVTKNFSSPKNNITYVPVWGAFQQYADMTNIFSVTYNNEQFPLFTPVSNLDPNIWDGHAGSVCCDLNNNTTLNEVLAEWNDRMGLLTGVVSSMSPLGGDAAGGPLLQYTRFVTFTTGSLDVTDKRVPKSFRHCVHSEELELPVLERKNSKQVIKKMISVFAPPNNSIYSEFTVGYSGIYFITESHKSYLPHFLIPVQEIRPSVLPAITQIQTAYMESNYLAVSDVESSSANFNSRTAEILSAMPDYITGFSGQKSEIAAFIDMLTMQSRGGFLSDLLGTVGSIGGALGFGGVAGIANAAGGIAKSLNL